MIPSAEPQPLLAVEAVAQRLGVSVKTVWRMRAAGEFPQPITIGRTSKRWPMEDVEAYIAKKVGAR